MHQQQNGNDLTTNNLTGMGIEWWRVKHEFFMQDFYFEYQQLKLLLDMLKKNPDDRNGDIFRELVKNQEKNIVKKRKEYKKIYGAFPKTEKIKKELGL